MDTGRKPVYDAKTGHIVNSTTCSCSACRAKFKLLRKEEKDRLKKAKRLRRLEKRLGGLQDITLFCCVFPEGFVGDCGFVYYGFCEVFEDACVRWNSFGDKKNLGVGLKNPFKVGDCCGS